MLVTGGVRSGKSRFAESRVRAMGPERLYLATSQVLDDEMADRVRRHQSDRDASWTTLEEPLDIAPLLSRPEPMLVDCLTLWLTNVLLAERDVVEERARLVAAVSEARDVVLVTNEVGLGIVPANALARRFRDEAGWLAQAVAKVCDEVYLTAAGLPLRLK
ncbi:MAG: bifunctional adenosylcobinamide kinase/adenosylcobinamide-phosphate guanylyltransferase [Proteobacteria bacterium]|nr:bifunctional adenosylcobinamide kinase/adenosylcobinamide-phosphate guanylyltransferase [Pseudomonadota bacterium]MCP4921234.1 bifunctional adenosylcobinamide kinase/adenosylcobinamide-phosphate guanylyltransferase [Pseudomonadota bacterium]